MAKSAEKGMMTAVGDSRVYPMRRVRQAIVAVLSVLMMLLGVTVAVIGLFHMIPVIEFLFQIAAGIVAFVLGVSGLSYLAQGKV